MILQRFPTTEKNTLYTFAENDYVLCVNKQTTSKTGQLRPLLLLFLNILFKTFVFFLPFSLYHCYSNCSDVILTSFFDIILILCWHCSPNYWISIAIYLSVFWTTYWLSMCLQFIFSMLQWSGNSIFFFP